MEELGTILNAVEALGTIGILAIGVWAFYTGKVMSTAVVEKMLESISQQTFKLASEIHDGMEKAIYHAIVAAALELRGQDGKEDGKEDGR